MKRKSSSIKKSTKQKSVANQAATSLAGYRLRIYPKKHQENVLLQWVGSKRWVYNTCLYRVNHEEEHARRKEFWMMGQIDPERYDSEIFYPFKQSTIDISRDLTDWRDGKPMSIMSSKDILDPTFVCQTAAWLADLPRTIITQSIRDLETAFSRYKEGLSEKPSYIHPSQTQSCRLQLDARMSPKKDGSTSSRAWVTCWNQNELFIPFLNEIVSFKNKQGLPKNLPKTLTIVKESTGHWYVSFAVTDVSPIWDKSLTMDQAGQHIVKAFDQNLGDDTRVVDSDGIATQRERYIEKSASHMAYLQQKMAKQEKDSQRYKENQRKMARIHKKSKNKRKDFIEKTTTYIVKNTAVICLEDLNVRGMIEQHNVGKAKWKDREEKDNQDNISGEKQYKNKLLTPGALIFQKAKLAKSLSDAGFGMFRAAIERKAKKHDREVIFCGQFTATSPICNQCGFRVEKSVFDLSVKDWTCPSCSIFHLRDHNSAINIKWEALAVQNKTARVFPQADILKSLPQAQQTEEFFRLNQHLHHNINLTSQSTGLSRSRTSRGGKWLFPEKRETGYLKIV